MYLGVLALSLAAALPPQPPLSGFSPARSMEQRQLEARFIQVPSPDSAARVLRQLTAQPHVAATPADQRVIEYLATTLRSLGFEVSISEYGVWLPHPKRVALTLFEPDPVVIENRESFSEVDPDGDPARVMPGWNAYSANGKVRGEVVYVNYGLPDDYAELSKLGVDTRGKIAIARYGRSHRGVKVKVAEEHGVTGLIIYSDPADDGYMQGDVYPAGRWRPADAIQRGNLMYEFQYVGDPLTPGRAALPGVPRDRVEDAKNLPKIPVLPLSYGNAARILRRLAGPNVPEGWQGGLPFAYHAGSGPAVAELDVQLDYRERPARNVIATLAGREASDQWVIVGNHHDAWTYGAMDPGSGTMALLEFARGLKELRGRGWRPRRTIKLAFWGAEEYGQIGSTEWGEEHGAELARRTVAYLNLDTFSAGTLDVAGSPSLRDFVLEAARDVDAPDGRSLLAGWEEQERRTWITQWRGRPAAERKPRMIELGELGGGSDFQVFLQHIGVPTLDVSTNGPASVYHAMQDNFFWYSNFADPGFRFTPAMARVMGLLVLRLSEADVLPFRYGRYADRIAAYLDDLERANLDDEGRPRMTLRLESLRAEVKSFKIASDRLDQRLVALVGRGADARVVNRALPAIEQAFLDDEGLPGRPWFRHLIYAPGITTGYAALPLPAPHQAILDGDSQTLERELRRLATVIRRATERCAAIGIQ